MSGPCGQIQVIEKMELFSLIERDIPNVEQNLVTGELVGWLLAEEPQFFLIGFICHLFCFAFSFPENAAFLPGIVVRPCIQHINFLSW